jgi:hypothetical protein
MSRLWVAMTSCVSAPLAAAGKRTPEEASLRGMKEGLRLIHKHDRILGGS